MDDDTLDLSRTAALGDPSTDAGRRALSDVFHLYVDTVEAACADMRRTSSPADVRRQAHRAKGASGVVGAVRLGRMFADIEARAAAGESIGPDTYDDLDRHLAALRQKVSTLTGDVT